MGLSTLVQKTGCLNSFFRTDWHSFCLHSALTVMNSTDEKADCWLAQFQLC